MSTRISIYTPDSSPRLHVYEEMTDDCIHIVNEQDGGGAYDDEVVLTKEEAREMAAAIVLRLERR